MRGAVKWFNTSKGYGFITDSEGNDHFVHYRGIRMAGFRFLNEDDIVEFETEKDIDDREQAVNVLPVLTRSMVRHALKKDNLGLKLMKDARGDRAYMVVDANNIVQTGDQGLSLIEVAAYAGIDTSEVEKEN